MTLSTYNFLWGIIKLFLPSYLERRQKKGKEDNDGDITFAWS